MEVQRDACQLSMINATQSDVKNNVNYWKEVTLKI